MKRNYLIAVAIISYSYTSPAQVETTNDPVGHFVSREALYQKDTLYEIRADINEDGFEDLLISSSHVDREYPKGRLTWDYYLSNAGNSYFLPEPTTSRSLILPIWTNYLARVEKFDNRKALLSIRYSNASEGSLWVYYFDDHELKFEKVDDLQFKQMGDTPENTQILDRLLEQSSILQTVSLTMEQALSPEAFSALAPGKEPDFFDLHKFAHNPIDTTNNIVIHKSTGFVVGNYKNGVFTPMDYPYGSDEKDIVDSSDKLARTLYADDIRAFLERRDGCDHLRGEEAYDAERARYLYEQMLKYCRGTDEELRLLREKYQRFPGTLGLLDSFDRQVEPNEWVAPE